MVEAGRQRDPRGRDPRRARHRAREHPQAVRRPAGAGREGRQAEDAGRDPRGSRRALRADPGLARGCALTRRPRSRTSSSARPPPRPSGADPGAVLGRPRGRDVRRVPRQRASARSRSWRRRSSASGSPSQKKRPDGRGSEEIRPISIEVDVAPRTHGSALFTRGQTQAFSVVALGTTREEMRLDTLGLETTKRYFHHYNFPPFSVGEAGFMRGPKRRDIGHGALAERRSWSR